MVFDPLGRLEEVILYRGMRQDKRDVPARKKIYKVFDVFPVGDGRTIWTKDWYFYCLLYTSLAGRSGSVWTVGILEGSSAAAMTEEERRTRCV